MVTHYYDYYVAMTFKWWGSHPNMSGRTVSYSMVCVFYCTFYVYVNVVFYDQTLSPFFFITTVSFPARVQKFILM